jgi:DNA-binding response OmpR family regulator
MTKMKEVDMQHILLVDDEKKLTLPLQTAFQRAGYQVSVANDGHTGLSMAIVSDPDVVILDVMMPGLDGWQVCQAIRKNSVVPIIMLTALDDSVDRIRGLELGADDYLVKPFGFEELQAHVKAMLRRVQLDKDVDTRQIIQAGEFELDIEARYLKKNGQRIELRQKEFEIVTLLMTHIGKVVTREQLFDEVWGTDWLGDTRTLDVHMSWIRSKLEDEPTDPRYCNTVRGVGYRFEIPK